VLNYIYIGTSLLDFIYIINTRYTASGYLIVLFKKEALSGLIVLIYNNILIAAIYKINIAVILVEISE
jgi:hypothetical protein